VAQNAPAPTSPPTSPRRDRTTLIVRLGLLTLFLIGIMTVFGESLIAVLFPSGEPPAASTPAAER
jgi:hypothetical protein